MKWMAGAVWLLSAALPVLSAADPGQVFIYAQRDTPAKRWIGVTCDGETVAALKGGFYFALQTSAGRHSLSVTEGVPVSVEVDPGATVFVRMDWNHDLRREPIPAFSIVREESARKELRWLSYVAAKHIRSASVLPATELPAENPQLKSRTGPTSTDAR